MEMIAEARFTVKNDCWSPLHSQKWLLKPASQSTQTVVWDVSVPDTSQVQLSSPLCYFLDQFSGSCFQMHDT